MFIKALFSSIHGRRAGAGRISGTYVGVTTLVPLLLVVVRART